MNAAENPLLHELESDEKVLWSGKSDVRSFVWMRIWHILLGIILVACLFGVLEISRNALAAHRWDVPWFLLAVYAIIIGYLQWPWVARNTWYVLTDYRVMMATGKTRTSLKMHRIHGITLRKRKGDIGDIVLRDAAKVTRNYTIFTFLRRVEKGPILYCVKGAESVCDQIRSLVAQVKSVK
jgi:hypothetical protein